MDEHEAEQKFVSAFDNARFNGATIGDTGIQSYQALFSMSRVAAQAAKAIITQETGDSKLDFEERLAHCPLQTPIQRTAGRNR